MIIVRSPLRVTLGGGGTDLPSYYKQFGGYVLSAAITQYVYVSVMKSFDRDIYLKYSRVEQVSDSSQIRHPIFREVLSNPKRDQLEICTMADIPAGTGLGSSGSFTTALLYALAAHDGRHMTKHELAEQACEIEIERLGDPIGKQDQFASSYGNIQQFIFTPDGSVEVRPIGMRETTRWELEDNLLLFYTGMTHSSSDMLMLQDNQTKEHDAAMVGSLHYCKELGMQSYDALMAGDLDVFADLMHEHWVHKRKRSVGISNLAIDRYYDLARKAGVRGGKLIGSGGGGFLMFYCTNKPILRDAMNKAGLIETRFRFDSEGTKIMP